MHPSQASPSTRSWRNNRLLLPSRKAWMPARNGGCEVSKKMPQELRPQANPQRNVTLLGRASVRLALKRFTEKGKSPAVLGLGWMWLGQHWTWATTMIGCLSQRAMGLAFILKFCVRKTISITSAEYANHIRMIDFESLMQLVFSLMIKNMEPSTFSPFTHQAPLTISVRIKRTQHAIWFHWHSDLHRTRKTA